MHVLMVLSSPLQQIRFTLSESIRFPAPLTTSPQLPVNSCSSPSPFPPFHNLFSDLVSTILPATDKGLVQPRTRGGYISREGPGRSGLLRNWPRIRVHLYRDEGRELWVLSDLEPATFRLVAQCLNQLRYSVTPINTGNKMNTIKM
jgi:hypothetical protein